MIIITVSENSPRNFTKTIEVRANYTIDGTEKEIGINDVFNDGGAIDQTGTMIGRVLGQIEQERRFVANYNREQGFKNAQD